ncbi:MAG: hypothetical protein K2G70_05940 [Turicibacter sp.]|nr:hypothetical protein [Turicibacter sp.]
MNVMAFTHLVEVVNEKSFWKDPLGWIARGVAQGISDYVAGVLSNMCDHILNFLEATSDTFTLFAVTILILLQVFGVDTAKRYRGIVLIFWLLTQGIIAFHYR